MIDFAPLNLIFVPLAIDGIKVFGGPTIPIKFG
jgi:hypothetical protein